MNKYHYPEGTTTLPGETPRERLYSYRYAQEYHRLLKTQEGLQKLMSKLVTVWNGDGEPEFDDSFCLYLSRMFRRPRHEWNQEMVDMFEILKPIAEKLATDRAENTDWDMELPAFLCRQAD